MDKGHALNSGLGKLPDGLRFGRRSGATSTEPNSPKINALMIASLLAAGKPLADELTEVAVPMLGLISDLSINLNIAAQLRPLLRPLWAAPYAARAAISLEPTFTGTLPKLVDAALAIGAGAGKAHPSRRGRPAVRTGWPVAHCQRAGERHTGLDRGTTPADLAATRLATW